VQTILLRADETPKFVRLWSVATCLACAFLDVSRVRRGRAILSDAAHLLCRLQPHLAVQRNPRDTCAYLPARISQVLLRLIYRVYLEPRRSSAMPGRL